MRTPFTLISASAVALACSVALISAQQAPPDRPAGPPPNGPNQVDGAGRPFPPPCGGPAMALADALNLTDQQRTALEQTMKTADETAAPLVAQLQQLRQDARNNGQDNGPSSETLAKVRQLRQQVATIHRDAMDTFAQTLTPEQQDQLKAMGPPPPGRGFGRGGRGGRGGPGAFDGRGPQGPEGPPPCGQGRGR